MKKHTRVLGILLAGMMAVSTMAMVPANAADITDHGWSFAFKSGLFNSDNYSYYNDYRKKLDRTYVYVYFQGGDSNGIHMQTKGRRNGGGWKNCTTNDNVYLRRGQKYSITNNIYESMKLNGSDKAEAALRANTDGIFQSVDAYGLWSPDSVGTFTIV